MDPVIEMDAAIVTFETRPSAAIRYRRPMVELDVAELFGEAMSALATWLQENELTSPGPPYARYFEFGGDVAEIEIGIPLVAAPADLPALDGLHDGEIGASSLPGGEVARIVHVGAYQSLGQTYARLQEWIREEGRRPRGAPWEEYVDDPGLVAEHARRTLVCMPV